MALIIILIILLVILFFWLKKICKKKITTYDSGFWSVIEGIWLFTSFVGICIGLYELNKVQQRIEYQEMESRVRGKINDIRGAIYGQTMYMTIDSTTTLSERESIMWFHTVQNLLEDGYQNKKWMKFLYYTRAFIFEEQGFLNGTQDNRLIFNWPVDLNVTSSDIVYRNEIRLITIKMIELEEYIDKIEKDKPDDSPLILPRHIFILFFIIALAFKLLKTYADYIRQTANDKPNLVLVCNEDAPE